MAEHHEDLEQELARGESTRSPFLALSGVVLMIGAGFALALAVAIAAYVLAR